MGIKLKKTYLTMVILVFTTIIGAQELPFSQVEANNFTMRGDVTMIGNSSVSIHGYVEEDRFGRPVEMQFGPDDDFNISLNNANLVMDYINIDEDDSTVSSSSADLILPSDCSKIKYAGLYWSGTYFWKKQLYWDTDALSVDFLTFEDTGRLAYLESDGTIVETVTEKLAYSPDRNYGENDPSVANPRTQNDEFDYRYIKFKPPGQEYIDITPTSTPVASQEFFDGFPRTTTNPGSQAVTDVPYVGYADVTSIIAGLTDPTGTYTVGNVKTFTGRTDDGGTAAGWALVITYEDPNESQRFISSFNGYAKINAGATIPVMYSYDGFQTPPTGTVNAKFGIAALEGDEGFVGDALAIKADSKSGFTTLGSSPLSPPNNFFDSSISNNGNNVTTRSPKSVNTLGFDLDMLNIANPNNSVIGNNETGVSYRTSTEGDTFGTFLNVFSVEVMEPDLRTVLRVEDVNEIPLQQGSGVVLGQELFYVLTVENIGNDAATETTILNEIPINVKELNSITLPEGVVVTFDPMLRRYTFTIPDNLVAVDAGAFEIRFKVQVVQSCELTTACSDEIKNVASISYEGVIGNVVVNNDPVLSELANCNSGIVSTTNFLVDFGECAASREEVFCEDSSVILIGGSGLSGYKWTNSLDEVIGSAQSITVTASGIYRLTAIDSKCRDIAETWTVTAIPSPCSLRTAEVLKDIEFEIYPNPTTGKVNITRTVDEVKLYNVSGKMVYQTKASTFDISKLPNGMYFAEITKGAVKEIRSILKK